MNEEQNNVETNKFEELRNKYPKFIYHKFEYKLYKERLVIVFNFEIEGLSFFKPYWSIDILDNVTDFTHITKDKLENLIFNLGMVELISYWKLTCSPKVEIRCGYLNEEQKRWWYKLYKLGLGEFLYLNDIDLNSHLMDFEVDEKFNKGNISKDISCFDDNNINTLVPLGGGKDSAATLELLKNKVPITCYIINPRKATLDTLNSSLEKNVIIAKRSLDNNMLELNKKGFLNGHTPFSALVAFSSVLAGFLNKIPYVALSNESSANESTVIGEDVNHQYSKSYEFEKDFTFYEKNYLNVGVNYFSLLRPFTELHIAKLFANYSQYHDIFRSCNAGSKEDIWCGKCSKCLFVYIILSPFLPSDKLKQIFGSDLLDDKELLSDFRKLIGLEKEKPFECVGSYKEVNAAIQFTIKNQDESKLSYLLKYYKENNNNNFNNVSLDDLINSYDENNNIPNFLKK